jgi:hypothetical protein
MGVLFTPFRTGAAHIVQFRPVGIENFLRQSAPIFDHRHQTDRREDDLSGQFGWSENRNCSAAHDGHLIQSLASFERSESSQQLLELVRQWLRQDRTIAGFQLATDCG